MTIQLQPLSGASLKEISKNLMLIGHRHQDQLSIAGLKTFAVSILSCVSFCNLGFFLVYF